MKRVREKYYQYIFRSAKRTNKMKLEAVLKYLVLRLYMFYKNLIKPETLIDVEMKLKTITLCTWMRKQHI